MTQTVYLDANNVINMWRMSGENPAGFQRMLTGLTKTFNVKMVPEVYAEIARNVDMYPDAQFFREWARETGFLPTGQVNGQPVTKLSDIEDHLGDINDAPDAGETATELAVKNDPDPDAVMASDESKYKNGSNADNDVKVRNSGDLLTESAAANHQDPKDIDQFTNPDNNPSKGTVDTPSKAEINDLRAQNLADTNRPDRNFEWDPKADGSGDADLVSKTDPNKKLSFVGEDLAPRQVPPVSELADDPKLPSSIANKLQGLGGEALDRGLKALPGGLGASYDIIVTNEEIEKLRAQGRDRDAEIEIAKLTGRLSVGELLANAGPIIGAIGDAFGELLGAVLFELSELVAEIWNGIVATAEKVWESVREALEAAADWVGNTIDEIIQAIFNNSPLVIDMDGDGVELVSLTNTSVYWDIDQDGFREATGWVAPDDGLLVLDQNSNGTIDDHSELFGSESVDGFSLLSEYDQNADGVIDQNDAVYSELMVWRDINQDGISDEGELITLEDAGIESINLAATEVDYQIEGNNITHQSSVTFSGGITRDLLDARFNFDNVNTLYQEEYEFDFVSAILPNLRGYGELLDLRAAMSIDNDLNDPLSLMSLVADFSELDFDQVFSDNEVALDLARSIMFRWAGSDDVVADSRGNNVDARELAFLEKLSGSAFLQHGYQPNPAIFSGLDLQSAFLTAQKAIAARLIFQTVGEDLIEGSLKYDVSKDSFDGVFGLDYRTLDDLAQKAADPGQTTDTTAFWRNVVLVVEEVIGINNLSALDLAELSDAISTSDPTLTLQDVQASLDFQMPEGELASGTTASEVLNGSSGNDLILGREGDDTLNGLSGSDELNGGSGNDLLDGGLDDDLSFGGLGDDTYIFNVNYGLDTILEDGGLDTIKFGPFISLNDLTITRVANSFLQIDVDTPQGGGSIVSENHFEIGGAGVIETLEFDDGSTFDLTSLDYTLTGTQFADTLLGVEAGGGINDTIFGAGGNDSINGKAGNDVLHGGDGMDVLDGDVGDDQLFGDAGFDNLLGRTGNDTLDGGADNDRLQADAGDDTLIGGTGDDDLLGGDGSDTYLFSYGDGDDIIDEFGVVTDVDRILFDASVPASMVTYARVNNFDLKIIVDGGAGGSITVKTHFNSSFKELEFVEFDDGSVVDLSAIDFQTFGTEGDDFINGISNGGSGNDIMFGLGGDDELRGDTGDDVLSGDEGNDILRGEEDNDTMTGGAGDDQLFGGIGNDTYVFDYGDGNDTFSESGTSGAETDIIELGLNVTANMLELNRINASDLQIVVDGGAGGSITLDRHFQSLNFNFDKIVLDDGSEIDLSAQNYTTIGSDNADSINGITVGGSNVDTIFAGDGADDVRGDTGNDTLYGEGGNDVLRGEEDDDVLIGGAGDDRLEGGSGADTYIFNYGDGNDTVAEPSGSNTVDVIQFGAGITAGMLAFSRVGANMVIEVDNGLGGSLTLENHFLTAVRNIEKIIFDDASEIDLLAQSYTTFGTDNAESIAGITNGGGDNDTIFGFAGNDQLIGGTGNDIIFGGDGLDNMTGNAGADTFVFEAGSAGNNIDVITDFDLAENDALDLRSAISFDASSGDVITDFVEIVDNGINSTLRIDADGLTNGTNFVDIATLNGINGLTDEAQLLADGTLIAEGANIAPMAGNDTAMTVEDTPVIFSVLDNDTDSELTALSIAAVSSAANGTVTHDGTNVTYTPNANFNGVDQFTYTVTDANGGTDVALVTVTVDPVNDAPMANDDAIVTDEDTAITIDVLGNDTDAENDVLFITGVSTATNGTVTHDGVSVTYTPNVNFNGVDSFTYTVDDGSGLMDTATVNVTVNPVNDSPTGQDDSFVGDEDTAITGNVLVDSGIDSDLDGDSLSVVSEVVSSVEGAEVVLFSNGDFVYTPLENYNGSDSFIYTVQDVNGATDVATVNLVVNAVNDAPFVENDGFLTEIDTPFVLNVLANDVDIEGDIMVVSSVSSPQSGIVTHDGTNITYTPNAGFNGEDSFTYTVQDSNGATSVATVDVLVGAQNNDPIPSDDVFISDEDVVLSGNVLDDNGEGEDRDFDLDVLSVVAETITTMAGGTVILSSNGDFTYTPAQEFNGVDGFSYTVEDGNGGSNIGDVTLNVTPVNDVPNAMDDFAGTQENVSVVSNVLENDTDIDGDTLTVTAVTNGANGTVTHDGTNTTYTPNANFTGSDSYTYTISDGNGGTDTATVNVTVVSVNDFPLAVGDAVSTNEDTLVVVDVLANDSDPDNDPLTISAVGTATNGTVTHDGAFVTYTPNANFNGTDSFTYTISDGNGGFDTATVDVVINAVNDDPDAVDDIITTDEDTAVVVSVLGNDTDVENDALAITSIGLAANGTVTHDGTNVTYTPNANFNGGDSFTYTISDGNGGVDTATVNVTVNAVNDAPSTTDDNVTTDEDTAVVVSVLGNDTDVDGDTLTIVTVGTASNGTVTYDGTDVTYTPDPNFNGSDNFTYTVADGNGGMDTATVNVTVNPVNDAPDAMDDAAGTQEDNAVVSNVLANDTDVDGDTLTITAVTNGANGTVTHDGTSTTYTPNLNFNGTDSYTYTISDGNGGTDTATVNVTVVSVNDFPLSVGDAVSTDEDTLVVVDVLANDSDADGDPLSITSVGTATNGTVTHDGAFVTYTPNANFNGADSFTYTISDGNGGFDTATVDVIVNAVNDDPGAVADSVTTDEDTAVVVDVRANDTDLDGDTLTITSVGVAANGTVTHDGVNVTYTPNANFNGADSFTYTISDGNGGVDTATVNVTVNAVNDNPVAVDDSATTDEDVAAVVNVLANDSDVDGDTLSISAVTNGTNGTVTHDGSTVTYTPNAGFFGTDSFSYTVTDGNGGTESATVNVTVNEVAGNVAPVAVDDVVSVNEDEVLNGNVLTNDTDADGDTLSAVPANITTSTGGTVVLNADGSFSYTPVADFHGPDTFDYTVNDGNGGSDIGTVIITVNSVNDLPAPQDDEFEMDYGTQLAGNVLADNGFGADSDTDGDALTVASLSVISQQGVTVSIAANGDFTYVAPPNFFGFDSFTYTVDDGNGGQETAVATIQVKLPAGSTTGSGIDDTLIGTGAADVFFGFEGSDFIDGKGGNDVLYGGSLNGTDTILGGGGNDVILGEGEGDNLSGEAGNDTIYGDGFGYETFVNGDDSIYGNGGDDTIYGGGGNDYIGGNGGADTLYGEDGDDLIQAGAGADTVHGGAGMDNLQGGGANDTLYGDAGNDTLYGQGGDDTIYGGDGNDTIFGGAGVDTIYGEAGDDIIEGNGGSDIIDAGEGHNTVYGGADDDNIIAGAGNDIIYGNGGLDTINAGDGNNSVYGGAGMDNITTGSGDDIIDGNGGADIMNAGDGNNTVTGGGDNDTITTGSGNDIILGNGGDDIINAGDGINTVTGGAGVDQITTGSGADTIEAKGGNDIVHAGAGADNIQGNGGDDFLDGGLGADTIFGGAGADIFDFNHTDAIDTISDFNLNHGDLNQGDVLDVSDLLTGFDPLSDTLSDWAQITDNGTDSFLSVDQDGAGTAFAMTQIAVLEGVTGLTDEDALVASGNLIV